ncbi:N-formylglutamate amidohydrolase [Salipiger sp. HF18]|uniref:N-formylglutamate amidohydrolase n=1 Tax=Salipiger sp. HF18 TaxID=2721557 RepID=UPI00142D6D17|nr:N-formylglutamate amidohydrolase [Salipiger sp. HF18]NIY96207.1 N-formylglutamate amidohydrolase [Salipiger sp. HF18]
MTEYPVILNPEGRFPGLIVVDHAGIATPDRFGALGLEEHWHATHHFCDLGVEPLARALADRLDAPVVLGTVSRLVLDLNRWLEDPRSIAVQVEGTPIPGNRTLTHEARALRQEAIFWPYHEAVGVLWARITARHADPVFLALHSCTRVFDGIRRPWDAGTIWNENPALSRPLLEALGRDAGLRLGDNQPYSGRGGIYTVDRHTHGSGLRACGIEISNDLLETPRDTAGWAARLAAALETCVGERERA